MKMRPMCYGCEKDAARGRMFCSARCAALYAEELVRGNEQHYCPICASWESASHQDDAGNLLLNCDHVASGITEGMSDKDARAKYTAATEARTKRIAEAARTEA